MHWSTSVTGLFDQLNQPSWSKVFFFFIAKKLPRLVIYISLASGLKLKKQILDTKQLIVLRDEGTLYVSYVFFFANYTTVSSSHAS